MATSEQATSGLPEFDRPPVVETAASIVFVPIQGWTLSHFARFGRRVEKTYPSLEPQDRQIVAQLEEFDGPPRPQELLVEAGASLWWYVDDKHGRLIQLQRDRYVHNWRKGSSTAPYPRYEQTREEFRRAWDEYLAFLSSEGLPSPTVLQVELDYVNHIERGAGWESAKDISEITPLLGRQHVSLLPEPEAVLLNVRYRMPNKGGRLHVTLQPAIRNVDKVQLLQLTITARIRPSDSELTSILAASDLAHEWIVNGFVDITTPKMHHLWGRKQ